MLTLLGLISSVYRYLPLWRSNQQLHSAEPKHYHWATGSHRTQVLPNYLVMVNALLVNQMSLAVTPVHSQRIRSPSGLHLPKSTDVISSIPSGVDHSIHCWWDLIKSKQLCTDPVCHFQCLLDFLVMVIQFIVYNSST